MLSSQCQVILLKRSLSQVKCNTVEVKGGPHIPGRHDVRGEIPDSTAKGCGSDVESNETKQTDETKNRRKFSPDSICAQSSQALMVTGPEEDPIQRPVLVLDLDETLLRSTFNRPKSYDTTLTFEDGPGGSLSTVYTKKRPYLNQFLEAMSEIFDIVVFTAARPEYATRAVKWIDHDARYIRRTLYRDMCTKYGVTYIKDLEKVGFDIHSTLIIDNRYNSFGLHPKNGIKCSSYYGDDHDRELLRLQLLLSRVDMKSGDLRAAVDNAKKEAPEPI
eukprot:gb/GECG01012871.1/.p1 GENE.gb/GECG01012871.1/~~gb/GECG01012871.1/.p1  ORF type:complete len:275 (+),score=20.35 gb/GECG01012871.1/:1-825(+)